MLQPFQFEDLENSKEFELTYQEFKIISKFLPHKYSLYQSNKNSRIKKIASNDNQKKEDIEIQKGAKDISKNLKVLDNKFKKPILNIVQNRCNKILQLIKQNKISQPFLKPVDPILMNIPDYFSIIKEPMDLGTVEKKLRNGDYFTAHQFDIDMKKIWSNAKLYNSPDTLIYKLACELSDNYEKVYEEEFYIEYKDILKSKKKIDKLTQNIENLESLYELPNEITNADMLEMIIENFNYLTQPEINEILTKIKNSNNNAINLMKLSESEVNEIYKFIYGKRFLIKKRKKNITKETKEGESDSELSVLLNF